MALEQQAAYVEQEVERAVKIIAAAARTLDGDAFPAFAKAVAGALQSADKEWKDREKLRKAKPDA